MFVIAENGQTFISGNSLYFKKSINSIVMKIMFVTAENGQTFINGNSCILTKV